MSDKVLVAFDSGVGGLSALAPLLQKTPGLEVFYFGDLANLPYGSKSSEVVRSLVKEGFEKLLHHVAQRKKAPIAGILACNTASALAIDVAQNLGHGAFPVLGVIESGCASVLRGNGKRIVVLGTQGTIQSDAYPRTLRSMNCSKEIIQKACPLFVPLVEENLLSGEGAEWIVDHYLKTLLQSEDDVVLACTHYPFLQPLLEKKFPNCRFYNAGSALVEAPELAQLSAMSHAPKTRIHFLFSDESVSSSSLASFLLRCGLNNVDWTQIRI